MSALFHCVYLAWKQLDRGGISGLSTCFFTTNTALRSVKKTLEHDESHVNLTRQYGKSPVITSAVLSVAFILPGSTHAAGSR